MISSSVKVIDNVDSLLPDTSDRNCCRIDSLTPYRLEIIIMEISMEIITAVAIIMEIITVETTTGMEEIITETPEETSMVTTDIQEAME